MKKLYLIAITSIATILSQANAQKQNIKVLSVPTVIQSQTNWCWAAASKAVINYYGGEADENQIVETARAHNPNYYGTVSCYKNPVPANCNKSNSMYGATSSIEYLLKIWKINSLGTDSAISFTDLMTLINERKPIIGRIAWKNANGQLNGGGHAVVLIGYNKVTYSNGTVEPLIAVMDPLDGIFTANYNTFSSNKSYSWSHTLKLTTAPSRITDRLAVSSDEEKNINQIKLYPNPVTDYLTISSDNKVILVNIFSSTGTKVNVNISEDGKINVSQLPSGIYILKAKLDDGKEISKSFIKK